MKNYLKKIKYYLRYRKIIVKQKEKKDCGPAVLAMYLRCHGINESVSRIAQLAGTDYYGTSGKGMLQAANKLFLKARGLKTNSSNDMFEIDEKLFPLIACIKGEKQFHYILILKIEEEEIIYIDPAIGIIILPKKDFDDIYSGFILVLQPTDKIGVLKKKNNSFIKEILFENKEKIVSIIIISLIISLLGIANSIYYRYLIDKVLTGEEFKSLMYITILTIGLIFLKGVMDIIRQYLILRLSEDIDNSMNKKLYKKILNLPFDFYNARNTGDIVTRLDDSNIVRDGICQTILTLFMDFSLAMVGFFLLHNLNNKLFILTLIPIVLYCLLMIISKNTLKKFNIEIFGMKSKIKDLLLESISGFEKIKSYQKEDKFFDELYGMYRKYTGLGRKYGNLVSIQMTFHQLINSIFSITILLIGSFDVINGNMTVGDLIMFNSLLYYFINPVTNIISMIPKMITVKIAKNRLIDLLYLDEESNDGIINSIVKYDIEFDCVNFGYNSRKKVLKDLSFRIEENEKIGIVGNSGSGKTTILNLIQNYYKSDNGKILLGDIPIDNYEKKILRQEISCVSQSTFLFNRSIIDNFKLANEKITLDEIMDICKKVKINNYIESLPDKYETIVYENGSNFSGGERQKICIAIALSRKPKVLLLDEATSSLDATSESIVNNIISELNDLTVIVVSHRLSLTKQCKKIMVLDNGNVAEFDTHENLLERRGIYYKLWHTQMGKSKEEKMDEK